MVSDKICPLMSGPGHAGTTGKSYELVPCVESKCQLWIRPYSTEHRTIDGMCAIAANPQMHEGLFRV